MYVHLLLQNFVDTDEAFIIQYGNRTVGNTVKAQKTEIAIYKVEPGQKITVTRKRDNTVILCYWT